LLKDSLIPLGEKNGSLRFLTQAAVTLQKEFDQIEYLVRTHPEERGGPAVAVTRLAREQAFTVLNRLAAVRMAEKRGLILPSVGKGYQSDGFRIYDTVAGKGLGDAYHRYRRYLFCLFDELALELGALFNRHAPQGLLFPEQTALLSLLELLNASDLEALWAEDETIGWIYQYYNTDVRGNPAAWPDDLPHPQANPTDEQGQLTNELFLGAIGFAVLHEIGHIVRVHRGMHLSLDEKHRQEFEADAWAYNWVMDRWRDYLPHTPLVHKKRCTLIASLFALIAIMHVRSPRNVETSDHPNTIDRLLELLNTHADENNGLNSGLAWAVSSTGIGLHLNQVSSDPWPTYNNSRDYFTEIRRRFPGL